MVQPITERDGARPGDDADDQLIRRQRATELVGDSRQHLRLHREQQDVGFVRRRRILVGGSHAVCTLELLAPLTSRMAAHHKPGIHQTLPEQARQHGLSHHAGADNAQLGVPQRVLTHGAPP